MLERLARFNYRHRWPVLGGWIALVIVLFVAAQVVGTGFSNDFQGLEGSETQAALDILEEHGFGDRTGEQAQIVFVAEQGVTDPAVQAEMTRLFEEIEATIPETSVVSPYEEQGQQQIAASGTIAYAEVNIGERSTDDYLKAGEEIIALGNQVGVEGLRIEYGGYIFPWEESGPPSEAIGLIAAAIILLIAFGSVLAMGLPIASALFGVGGGVALLTAATRFQTMPDFTIPAAAMIGIGVGIDYALFVVTRFRQGLHDGMDPEDAAARALTTSGRAVIFAGITVVISIMGMFVVDLEIIRGMAVGVSATVLMTMLASVTLLPALLGFVRERIDRLGLPHRNGSDRNGGNTFWHRWSRVIQNRPLPAALGGLLILLVLTVPFFSMRLGFSDAGNWSEDDTARRAYDLLSEGFGPGFNGPMLVAAETPGGEADLPVLQALSEQLNQTEGVAYASPPFANEQNTAAIIQLIPTTSPQDKETEDLVHRLRDEVVPAATAGSELDVKVGGSPAIGIDFSEYLADRMPIFIGAVLGLSFLVLMLVFRSLLVPVKAVIMNLLSIGSAFGATVAVFQWGWFADVFGVGKPGPFEAWAPLMIFAIVFGLSMDYEVFLLSRIREEFDRTGDNASAVADGLANTARVITAAAAIMIFVFGSFVLSNDRGLQMLGFGLAAAVLIDATLVRLVLVPATMELLGKANWWLPRWLQRVLPEVHVEAAPEPVLSSPAAYNRPAD
ncbi:MAG TPA: MMPL family transporter [Thermomicrobiales bacterium]|nr:MMPL family transporter [Thermomicrobiales bacterium]